MMAANATGLVKLSLQFELLDRWSGKSIFGSRFHPCSKVIGYVLRDENCHMDFVSLMSWLDVV